MACPTGRQGQGWLTEGGELRDAGALALGLGGGLAYLPLEGGEEVLAKLFGHICLQVGLHEDAKALIVDGLGRRTEEDGGGDPGTPWGCRAAGGGKAVPWASLTGCINFPKPLGFPNPSSGIQPKGTQKQQDQKSPVPAGCRGPGRLSQASGDGSRDRSHGSRGRSWGRAELGWDGTYGRWGSSRLTCPGVCSQRTPADGCRGRRFCQSRMLSK